MLAGSMQILDEPQLQKGAQVLVQPPHFVCIADDAVFDAAVNADANSSVSSDDTEDPPPLLGDNRLHQELALAKARAIYEC